MRHAATSRSGPPRWPTCCPGRCDPLRSIKLKISVLLVASGGARRSSTCGPGDPLAAAGAVIILSAIASLLITQMLAHGMTRPLREMTAAARAMARGDYRRRVRRDVAATRSASWPRRSTRWPPTWPPRTSSAAS